MAFRTSVRLASGAYLDETAGVEAGEVKVAAGWGAECGGDGAHGTAVTDALSPTSFISVSGTDCSESDSSSSGGIQESELKGSAAGCHSGRRGSAAADWRDFRPCVPLRTSAKVIDGP
mmetsp:Transcript_4261/g.7761  ORF Transcript_4261/g.7761 Transcript_4261/m.7761 type:complete len:118 (+) Transcript_4261:2800-3153(+)